MTEFFDYECSACSMMAPVMEKVMAANAGVRFAFRDWTIFAARYPESSQASHRGLGVYRKQGQMRTWHFTTVFTGPGIMKEN